MATDPTPLHRPALSALLAVPHRVSVALAELGIRDASHLLSILADVEGAAARLARAVDLSEQDFSQLIEAIRVESGASLLTELPTAPVPARPMGVLFGSSSSSETANGADVPPGEARDE